MIAIGPVIPGAAPLEKVIAEHQEEYQPLPVFQTELASISRWRLSDEERAHIAAGGDLFLAQLNFGHQLQPIMPMALDESEVLPTVLSCEEALRKEQNP